MREWQNKAYDLVWKEGFLIKAKHQAANEKLNSVLRQRSNFEGRQWVWVYDDKSTIRAAGKHVLKASVNGVEASTVLDRPVLCVDRGPWQGARR